MVKVAIAGGSGHIASEIVDVLVATQRHEILILSRKDPSAAEAVSGVSWAKADYGDKEQLTGVLSGVHTVLSFVGGTQDPGSVIQKNLIDASIAAGVKRFAPSEWSSSSIEELPWYAEKAVVRTYLEEINKEKKMIEYTLFQPGLIVDYLAPPGTTKHLQTLEILIDFPNRRAIDIDGKDGFFTLTTMNDVANVVALAIEYEGEWPVIGGINGINTSTSKVLEIGAKIQGGKPFDITLVKEEDVRADVFQTPWCPMFKSPDFSEEQLKHFSKVILRGCLLSFLCGSWVVSDAWNRLLPDYKFTNPEEFLLKAWEGKA
ncbi:related to 2`-hydroxyisoflavone reductase [Phialocephala subalpina]|uniref:Related to 2`-hydroxyisoflavone reductase n=1 Tax=Phialocephala subalpina TaxID=576137 RepID=A0A1L7X5Z7_9HELO|nr:related to 2`-hydroxyisoflavone reductase [Phialocephala subalpina]